MSDLTSRLFEQLCTGYGNEAVTTLLRIAFKLKPELEKDWQQIRSIGDIEDVIPRVVGEIEVSAGTGPIGVDVHLLQDLRGIEFDHEKGIVSIGNLRFSAQIMVTRVSPVTVGRTAVPGPLMNRKRLATVRRALLGDERPVIGKRARIEPRRRVRLD